MTGSVLLHNFVTCGKTFFCFNLHYCQSNTPKASDFAKCRFIFETPPEVEYPSGPASRSDRCGGSQPATEKQARIGKGTSWFVHVWNQGGKQPKPTKCGFKRLSPSLLLRLSYFLFGPRSSPFFPACWACRCLPPFLTGVNTKVSHMNCGTWCCRVRLYLAFKPHFVCVCVFVTSHSRAVVKVDRNKKGSLSLHFVGFDAGLLCPLVGCFYYSLCWLELGVPCASCFPLHSL